MKATTVSLKTLAIKARVTNKFRKLFYKEKRENFTEKQKAEIFDQLFSEIRVAHNELNSYKATRKYKAKIEAERIARDYKPKKKKMTKAEYEASLVTVSK